MERTGVLTAIHCGLTKLSLDQYYIVLIWTESAGRSDIAGGWQKYCLVMCAVRMLGPFSDIHHESVLMLAVSVTPRSQSTAWLSHAQHGL